MNASELAKMRQDRRKHSVAVVQPVRALALSSCRSLSAALQLDQSLPLACHQPDRPDHIIAPRFNRTTHSNPRIHHSTLRRSSRPNPEQTANHPLHQPDLLPTKNQKILQRHDAQATSQSEKASRESRPTQCPCSSSANSTTQEHNRLTVLGSAHPRNNRRSTIRRCSHKSRFRDWQCRRGREEQDLPTAL